MSNELNNIINNLAEDIIDVYHNSARKPLRQSRWWDELWLKAEGSLLFAFFAYFLFGLSTP